MMTKINTPADLLKEVYLSRKEKNPSYSLRAYARDLKVSQTLITLILQGKRSFTLKTAKKMSPHMMLSETEEATLIELISKTKRVPNFSQVAI